VETGLLNIHLNGAVKGATNGQRMDTDSEVYGHDQPRPVAAKQRVLVKEKEAFHNNARVAFFPPHYPSILLYINTYGLLSLRRQRQARDRTQRP
jgi:hypothetical protein